ncbi:ABC transporter ATP-binding protein/permease [Streptomyces sp. XM4193]|uniref:ATP-binding cassette domain-containing protein n=1 Tax=Streptomyces sp. XM4193 TaxID=2929782 RepID=UPI001FF7ECE5|nr:ABC transporter ATP-binding protein [Streptomyces sp. XM4193]MCK1798037.1 ABC transporter ATP-binding protein/permease [Streptomyces sp. XM4193]
MKELWQTLRGHRPRFLALMIAEAGTGGIEALLHPLLLKAIFDQAILAGDFHRFALLGGCYLVLGLTLNLAAFWISTWRKRFENTVMLGLESELLGRTLALDGRRLSGPGHASYVSRIHNDVKEGVLPSIDVCVRVGKLLVTSVVFLGVLLWLSWQASLVLLLVVPPLVLVSNRLAKQIEKNTGPEREAEAGYVNRLSATLGAFHALRGMPALMPATRETNRRGLGGYLDLTYVNYRLTVKQRTLSNVTMNLSDTASMVVGAFFVFSGRMTFGSFLAFVNSLWRAVTGIFDLINLIPQVRRNTAVLRRIHSLRESRHEPCHREGAQVRLRGASVRHDPRSATEVRLPDFELAAGEKVLLRGPNGCGKTTLLHVLGGTLAPDTGAVTLPPRVAALTAPVNLPPLPVGELVPDAELRGALMLDGLLDQLPANLSSGQRQRVGVAALLGEEADVYLADEPFANLDEHGRDTVLRELVERTAGRALLVVHHGEEGLDVRFDRVVTLRRPTGPAPADEAPATTSATEPSPATVEPSLAREFAPSQRGDHAD